MLPLEKALVLHADTITVKPSLMITCIVCCRIQFTLVQIPNSHSLMLKTVNSSVIEMKVAFASSQNCQNWGWALAQVWALARDNTVLVY